MYGRNRKATDGQSVRQVACMAKERDIIYGRNRKATDGQSVRKVACMAKERDI